MADVHFIDLEAFERKIRASAVETDKEAAASVAAGALSPSFARAQQIYREVNIAASLALARCGNEGISMEEAMDAAAIVIGTIMGTLLKDAGVMTMVNFMMSSENAMRGVFDFNPEEGDTDGDGVTRMRGVKADSPEGGNA